jgi:hypothetical protein
MAVVVVPLNGSQKSVLHVNVAGVQVVVVAAGYEPADTALLHHAASGGAAVGSSPTLAFQALGITNSAGVPRSA